MSCGSEDIWSFPKENGTKHPKLHFQNTYHFAFPDCTSTKFHFLSLLGETIFVPISVSGC